MTLPLLRWQMFDIISKAKFGCLISKALKMSNKLYWEEFYLTCFLIFLCIHIKEWTLKSFICHEKNFHRFFLRKKEMNMMRKFSIRFFLMFFFILFHTILSYMSHFEALFLSPSLKPIIQRIIGVKMFLLIRALVPSTRFCSGLWIRIRVFWSDPGPYLKKDWIRS